MKRGICEACLTSEDMCFGVQIDGTVIVWKREHAEDASTGQQEAEDAETTETGLAD